MLNVVAINGRLTADPELVTTQSGTKVTSFNIAVERNSKSASGERISDFFQCVAWRHNAEFICSYFQKGSVIGLLGELQTYKFEDRDGNKRTGTQIVVSQASFCGNKASKSDEKSSPNVVTNDSDEDFCEIDEISTSDDLPF